MMCRLLKSRIEPCTIFTLVKRWRDVKHERFELLAFTVLLRERDEAAACGAVEGQSLRLASHVLG